MYLMDDPPKRKIVENQKMLQMFQILTILAI